MRTSHELSIEYRIKISDFENMIHSSLISIIRTKGVNEYLLNTFSKNQIRSKRKLDKIGPQHQKTSLVNKSYTIYWKTTVSRQKQT